MELGKKSTLNNIKGIRIRFLDGFRGLAILLVIGFHAFSEISSTVPYGTKYLSFPIFHYGWLGVELFFLISGFVIIMTLEKCLTIKEFLVRRWLRLFPCMLIASILIFVTASFLHERPLGLPKLIDILPGLTFIEPSWWATILNQNQIVLEASFWSLFVEVKFYIVFGILYFSIGRKKAINGLAVMFLISIILKVVAHSTTMKFTYLLNQFIYQLSFEYFGWFSAGALMYIYFKNNNRKTLIYSIIIGFLSACLTAISHGNLLGVFLSALIILFIFYSAFIFETFKKIFENKFLNFIGFVSYPLYLIHENSMLALIIKINKNFRFIPSLILPLIPITLLVLVSFIITKYGEPKLKKQLKKIMIKSTKGNIIEYS